MSIFKCKMCGGDLELIPGQSVAECEHCGSRQTVPAADNEKKLNLFARANRLRAGCEFDKAAGIYETIVADFPEEAEAYWGLVLCRYGIEYVDDPATGNKIPTCHRTSFDSVLEDSDFEQACENADAYARRVYRDEAKAIETLRKKVLAVSNREDPYDIFICYKETDPSGERTLDSVLGQDIYDALTEKGYRVFFSRISLEDKLGEEYEPYIFAALNSAKVMLAIGTDYEYFNAVWVKNEWSRFLQLIASGRKKTLIPCFKNLDPYDMPKEFAKLQSQDLGKVGAMQDLLRGVEKILAPVSSQTVVLPSSGSDIIQETLARAYAFMEESNWDAAKLCLDTVRGYDPKNAHAQIGYLMLALKTPREENLADATTVLAKNAYYQRALEYADAQTKERLECYNQSVIYAKAFRLKEKRDPFALWRSRKLFRSVSDYRDAENQILQLDTMLHKWKHWGKACLAALGLSVAIGGYITQVFLPAKNYEAAEALMDAGKYTEAVEAFKVLGDYKDSANKAVEAKLKTAKVGDYVSFGAYEQDNKKANGKEEIEWLVLDRQEDKILVISKYALDCQPYNKEFEGVTWENCTLRKWLNDDFLNAAFSKEEQAMIPTVTVSADKNPKCSTDPGNDTQDQVFLLSISEAEEYFASDNTRQCAPTDYAVANGAGVAGNGNWDWWLRSPGGDQNFAVSVNYDSGFCDDLGLIVNCGNIAVRPALWIDLNS